MSEEKAAKMIAAGCCEEIKIHEDLMKKVTDTLPDEEDLYDLAELFKIFGDSLFCLRQKCVSAIWQLYLE